MKTLAIICEYNPFHNGHFYQFYKAKQITNAGYIIVIMSGNFVQRGEPAIVNKYARTEMAISSGADLVLELPFVFSTQDANGFSFGSISLLNALNSVHYLCFGCENNDLNLLNNISYFLNDENSAFKDIFKKHIKNGYGYPKARALALCEYHEKFGINELKVISSRQLNKLLSSPNNILAIEYIKHLIKTKSNIQPVPIMRIGASYHDEILHKTISSATSIRKDISRIVKSHNQPEDDSFSKIRSNMPSSAYQILKKELSKGKAPVSINRFEQYILAKLRNKSIQELSMIQGVNEGLENRIKKAALKSTNIDQLLSLIKTRRYTLTKIKRILIHIMFDLSKEDVYHFNRYGSMYARVLGFSTKGESLLRKLKKNSKIPIIIKLSSFLRKLHSEKEPSYKAILKMINFDILAGDLYNLGYPEENERIARTDFSDLIIKK